MPLIENPKNYTGQELDAIFFRPSFTGENAQALGLRVIFNLPVNTTLNFWERRNNILQTYAKGWKGGDAAQKFQKKIELNKIKAEQGISPEDYFAMIYERIACDANVDMQDLSGTTLETAEVQLFREAIAEDVRNTMWIGDTAGEYSLYKAFDGFLKKAKAIVEHKVKLSAVTESNVKTALDSVLKAAPAVLTAMKSSGKLVFFVTSDVYNAYEAHLDSKGNSTAYREMIDGRPVLKYHGIELKEIHAEANLTAPESVIILTHKENLVLALNTKDMPEAEVRLWYNPDEMENRRRACFLAGTQILDENIVVFASTLNE